MVNAQKKTQRAGFSVGSTDKSYADFFRRNNQILSINIDHTNIITLIVNKKETDPSKNGNTEIFVLSFAGDEYLFKKKYGEIKIPSVFDIRFSFINDVNNADLQKSFFNTYTTIKPDSIIHRYSYYTYQGDLDRVRQSADRQHPMLRSDFSKLQAAVDKSYTIFEKKVSKRTILMYSGRVDKKGKLSALKLIEGKESQFSKRLMQTIENEDTLWWPVMQGGRLSERSIRIFVNINPNKTLSLSML